MSKEFHKNITIFLRFLNSFFQVILLLILSAEYIKAEQISTGKFVRNKATTLYVKNNYVLTFDNLTSSYYTSDESAARCARRCINDEMCAAFDVRGKDDDVSNKKCALRQLQVLS